MSTNTHGCRDINDLAKLFKLLAEPNRLRILCSLDLECRPVSAITEVTGLSQTNVSFHLRSLREAGLVRPDRQGAFIYYCLPNPEFLRLLDDFRDWMESNDNSDGAVSQGKVSRE